MLRLMVLAFVIAVASAGPVILPSTSPTKDALVAESDANAAIAAVAADVAEKTDVNKAVVQPEMTKTNVAKTEDVQMPTFVQNDNQKNDNVQPELAPIANGQVADNTKVEKKVDDKIKVEKDKIKKQKFEKKDRTAIEVSRGEYGERQMNNEKGIAKVVVKVVAQTDGRMEESRKCDGQKDCKGIKVMKISLKEGNLPSTTTDNSNLKSSGDKQDVKGRLDKTNVGLEQKANIGQMADAKTNIGVEAGVKAEQTADQKANIRVEQRPMNAQVAEQKAPLYVPEKQEVQTGVNQQPNVPQVAESVKVTEDIRPTAVKANVEETQNAERQKIVESVPNMADKQA